MYKPTGQLPTGRFPERRKGTLAKDSIRCSFCGKRQEQVNRIIAGPNVYICNECVDLCNSILHDEMHPGSAQQLELPDKLPTPQEIKTYMDLGCDEIDMWMNIAALKNAEFDYVVKDIQAVRAAMKPGHNLKVIIEPATLTEEQIELAVQCVIDGGADFVKAGTGFIGPCTLRHAELMLRAADGKVKVKCSGGIRDVETVKQMVDMGVARIGMGVGSSLNIYRALNAENE